MVAYSFKARFAQPIIDDTKRQTIRSYRKNPHPGRAAWAGHCRPGEELQLYTGMRTAHCKLIGKRTCAALQGVSFSWERSIVMIGALPEHGTAATPAQWKAAKKAWRQLDNNRSVELDAFARSDGFKDWKDLWDFWNAVHRADDFEGVMIMWHPTTFKGPANAKD